MNARIYRKARMLDHAYMVPWGVTITELAHAAGLKRSQYSAELVRELVDGGWLYEGEPDVRGNFVARTYYVPAELAPEARREAGRWLEKYRAETQVRQRTGEADRDSA